MKKKVILLLLAVSFVLTGCGYSKQEKIKMEKYEKQASTNAVSYIKNKYDIDAKLVSVEILFEDPNPTIDFSPDATGYVKVKMKYDNYTFGVIISGKEATDKGRDNYQFREITNDALAYIKSITKVDPVRYAIYFQDFENDGDNGYINYVYDSSMIEGIVEDSEFSIILEYLNGIDLAALKENTKLKGIVRLLIIEYKSEALFNSVKKPDIQQRGVSILNVVRKDSYAYDEVLYNNFEEYEYYKFNTKKIDNVYYNTLDENDTILSRTTMNSPDYWDADEQVSNSYLVKNYQGELTVFIPKSEIKEKNAEKLIFAIECVVNAKKEYQYFGIADTLNGNYYSIDININCGSELKFSIMKK